MDPTTTLFTFMLQTHPSVQAVHLVGSWDNFSKAYTMERDSRRDRSQWRGCYTFKDIVCEGEAGSIPKRTGGLKMGHTYYYYYELDGGSETHDSAQPSTNTCPYLPGQTVNTLWVPVEQSLRKRSASLNSLHEADFKTMDPATKFVSPRPAPTPPEPTRRLGTAPFRMQPHKRSARSLSPSSAWRFSPRKLFSRKSSSSSLKDTPVQRAEDARSVRSEGSRSRDISPESLRKFLVDDVPRDQEPETNDRPALYIPEDIVEENEDDDNFATSAISESMQYTGLSPPPQRTISPCPVSSALSLTSETRLAPSPPTRAAPRAPAPFLQSPFLFSPATTFSASTAFSLDSPDSASPVPGFYHDDIDDDDDDDEEDVFEDAETLPISNDEDDEEEYESEEAQPTATTTTTTTNPFFFARNLEATLSTYSLPKSAAAGTELEGKGLGVSDAGRQAATQGGLLLSSPIPDAGLRDLVSELGWMADLIRGEYV